MNDSLTLLDCTLRDGGYYNDWKFSPELVHDYLNAMAASGVAIVELGFRFFPKDRFLGALAYTTDDYLRSLRIPPGVDLSVMVNASELVGHARGGAAAVDALFGEAQGSPVRWVRLAAHYHELAQLGDAIARLQALGYRIGLNLMQITSRSAEEIAEFGRLGTRFGVDVLYVADSLGSLQPDDVAPIFSAMRTQWAGPCGIHTHDNMGAALANTMAAARCGATWLDSTVLGMGRGPGNVRTEYLLLELARTGHMNPPIAPVLRLLSRWFEPMQRAFGWGPNPYYFLSGVYGIHPTYVQEMLSDGRYEGEDVLGALEFIRRRGGERFHSSTLASARDFYSDEPTGSWDATGWARGRDVLLLANGPQARTHAAALAAYVRRDRPLVVALNIDSPLGDDLVDLHAACHPVRLLMDGSHYRELGTPVVLPVSALPDDVRSTLGDTRVMDYGMSIRPGHFEFRPQGSIVPSPLVAAYALALATAAGARRILLAGFDGYAADDARQREMLEVLELYRAAPGSLEVIAVTPSRYPVTAASVYAPTV